MSDTTGIASVDTIVIWSAAAVAVAALLALLWRLVRMVLRVVHLFEDFLDDWKGTPDRPGVPGRSGVMTRLGRIEHELVPNSGHSLRDAVDRVEANTAPPE